MSGQRNVTLLGATGSIGASTLDVISRHPDRYRVFAVTAHHSAEALLEICKRHRPRIAVLSGMPEDRQLRRRFTEAGGTELVFGAAALEEVAAHPDCDTVMAAIVGAAGLQPTLAAARAGRKVLLANKEALVMAGPVFMREVESSGAVLLPIDSEHNAVFQSLPSGFVRGLSGAGVTRIVLTASGGPFRDAAPASLADVTPEQAVAHPNWSMGRKISVDSATMMNKGLEVIEAHFLFGLPAERIDVVIHPQSVVHSMAEYVDGSVIAELGNPDMRTPIAHALAWPERIVSGVAPLDLVKAGRLDFATPDLERFPCLALAYRALRAGGSAPAVLNAANEVAVDAFLERRIRFTDIAGVVTGVLDALPASPVASLDDVLAADSAAREAAHARLGRNT